MSKRTTKRTKPRARPKRSMPDDPITYLIETTLAQLIPAKADAEVRNGIMGEVARLKGYMEDPKLRTAISAAQDRAKKLIAAMSELTTRNRIYAIALIETALLGLDVGASEHVETRIQALMLLRHNRQTSVIIHLALEVYEVYVALLAEGVKL